jgi:alpha-methylacyl-CoA racemase
MPGPLAGVRLLEFAGMGPGPFAAMLLADMGAEVIRIDRPQARVPSAPGDAGGASRAPIPPNPLLRGRRSIALDLKHPAAAGIALRLAERTDLLIEGYRPGTMDRLGLGPGDCLERNPRLVYGRATGWGQTGPLRLAAGHDLNYLALSGALHAIGRAGQPPTPPVNLLGDYAGGGLYLAFGLVCALREVQVSGRGQVVDAAIVDGAAGLTTTLQWMTSAGAWDARRGTNELDSGAPYYDVYETADGEFVSVAALEPKFYAELCRVLRLSGPEWNNRDRDAWPRQRKRLTEIFLSRTRDEWTAAFAGADACFAPVLSPAEAPAHPHHAARGTFASRDGVTEPAPAPRLSRTPGAAGTPAAKPGQHTTEVLRDLGLSDAEIEDLVATGAAHACTRRG